MFNLLWLILAAPGLEPTEVRHRSPVALAVSTDGNWLYAAHRSGGGLSIVDARTLKLVGEIPVGKALADVAAMPDGRHLLAVDRSGNKLIRMKAGDGSASIDSSIEVASDPVSVAVHGSIAIVASGRSRTLTVVAMGESMSVARTFELTFDPRCVAWAGSRVIVADAYGGRIAVVDPSTGPIGPTLAIPANNIRGLAVTPDGRSLVVAHQTVNRLARSNFEDVHWGSLIGNHLRILNIDALTSADPLKGSRLVDLGDVGDGAGDPGAVAFGADGRVVVAISGLDRVLLGPNPMSFPRRVEVGRKPSSVVASRDGLRFFVADELDDTISVVDFGTARTVATISLGPRPALDSEARGERLFSDAKLSHDGWMSCQSCHTDGRSNGQVADTLGDGSFGAPKRVTTLMGAWETAPWTWLGGVHRLEDQVRKSIETSMQGKKPTDAQVDDLTAYLKTLDPPRRKAEPDGDLAAYRGWELFRTRGCAECHAPPLYTSPERHDVGLSDEAGNRRFNPPSLRDVGHREPLLHDGRAQTLGDVFIRHKHPRDSDWTEAEVNDLVRFLRTL